MKSPKRIRGSGGGGGGKGGNGNQHVPTESADSLRSKAYAQVVDLISEGEIEGLVSGLKSIYLDRTPIQNADGTYNFSGLLVQTRVGTQGQAYMPGFSNAENEINVATEVTYGSPVTRQITNSDVDSVRVRVSIPTLTYQNPSTGDLGGNSVNFAIDLQSNGAGYVEQVNDTVTGKSTSKYERTYLIQLPAGGAPWDVRVRRITANSTTSNDQKRTIFESYTEIEDLKLRYPNSALVGTRIDSAQFQNVPTRSFDIKGLRIQVPSNYNPTTRVYSGSWDGTWQIAWTDNPAWIFRDLVLSTRYGLGQFISEDHLDKWSLYTIAQYCDELVDDGFGGTEPRFTCNLYLQSRADAYKVISDLASIFRGMIYWSAGVIQISQDSPQDAIALYSPANVVDGMFTYQGASAKARHTVALVTWNDPADFYSQKVEYVEDSEGVANYGVIETQVVAVGCTSRGQAHRMGRWILYTEKYQTEVVTFQTGVSGAVVRPGQVIKVADPVRAGVRRGGRVSSGCTTTSLILDDELGVSASDLTISVMLPDGTVEEKSVATVSGRTVGLNSALSSAPQEGAIWLANTTAVEPQTFRVVSIAEPKPGVFEITALAHNPDKFALVEQGIVLEARSVSSLTAVPAAPTDLQITETLYAVGADVRVKVTCSWRQVDGATGYLVQWQRDSQNVITMQETQSIDVEVLNAEPGLYTFTVYAMNSVGIKSSPATVSQQVNGKGAAPTDVSGFSLVPLEGHAYLSWDESEDLDVLIGGSVRIRYSPDISTPTWKDSVDVVPALPGTATRVQAPLLTGTYLAKFIDSSGNTSLNEATIVTTVPDALALNVVSSFSENPGFSGTKTNMEYNAFYSGILLSSALFDDNADVDSLVSFDYGGGVFSSGEYAFSNSVDLGAVYTSRITAALTVSAIDVADSIDQRTDDMDDWRDMDGTFIDDVNAELFLRTSEDGVTYTAWKRFFVSTYRARYIQFKLVATSNLETHNVVATGISITVDMEDRVVNLPSLTSGAGLYSVTFPEPFKATPAIGITADGMNSGDYFTVANKTRSGFDITFKNSGGTAISKTFDVLAKGYGRQV
jgi:predicted phage tail protein